MSLRNRIYLFVAVPLVCILISGLLLISYHGLPLDPRPSSLGGLTARETTQTRTVPEILLLSAEETALVTTVEQTLDEMRIPWAAADRLDSQLLEQVHTVLVCAGNLPNLEGEAAVTLLDWVESGGRLGLMTSPAGGGWFQIVGHKLGVIDSGDFWEYHALRTGQGVLPVYDGLSMDEDLTDYALQVWLEGDCQVFLYTQDEAETPLLWSREIGQGRAVVCNHSLISGKDARGYVLMALQALEPVLVYPIINAGMVFIDDFPAPQPEGFDERIQQQYGVSIQSFYRNHWWPDMKALARSYGLRYTGVLVETYNQTMHGPFEPDSQDNALIRYYMSELLQSGGEVGLHGYNHQPLCPAGWQYADEDYVTWDSPEDMAEAVQELVRYGNSFLPQAVFTSYVPPSNYLSAQGQQVLVDTVPDLQAISGVYLPEEGVNALVQEFEENPDGTVSVPRIASGFSMDSYQKLVTAGELGLHGVFSHFIHPDDVLDEERGALLGWEQLLSDLDATLAEITGAYPALRWCTATQAAAAVQRYDRVQVKRTWTGSRLTLTLDQFYDEQWLCLWASEEPDFVEGAEVYPAGNGFWLRAWKDTVVLDWGDGA